MINPNFNPEKDDPHYYYLDQYGCPYMTKEQYDDTIKNEETFINFCKQNGPQISTTSC